MNPYVTAFIPPEDQRLWKLIRRQVSQLPNLNFGKDDNGEEVLLSCHILARAVGNVHNIQVVDGHWFIGFEHSWCVTEHGNIIDVYPVATLGGVTLVHGDMPLINQLYRRKESLEVSNARFETDWFERAVEIVAKGLSHFPTVLAKS